MLLQIFCRCDFCALSSTLKLPRTDTHTITILGGDIGLEATLLGRVFPAARIVVVEGTRFAALAHNTMGMPRLHTIYGSMRNCTTDDKNSAGPPPSYLVGMHLAQCPL